MSLDVAVLEHDSLGIVAVYRVKASYGTEFRLIR